MRATRSVQQRHLLVHQAGVRACREKDPHHVEVAHSTSTKKRRVAVVILQICTRTVLEEKGHHVSVALLCRADEGSGTEPVTGIGVLLHWFAFHHCDRTVSTVQ